MNMKTNDNGIDRDMTETEIEAYEKLKADQEKEAKERTKAEAAQAKAKQIVLDRLGITAEEAALLLG